MEVNYEKPSEYISSISIERFVQWVVYHNKQWAQHYSFILLWLTTCIGTFSQKRRIESNVKYCTFLNLPVETTVSLYYSLELSSIYIWIYENMNSKWFLHISSIKTTVYTYHWFNIDRKQKSMWNKVFYMNWMDWVEDSTQSVLNVSIKFDT